MTTDNDRKPVAGDITYRLAAAIRRAGEGGRAQDQAVLIEADREVAALREELKNAPDWDAVKALRDRAERADRAEAALQRIAGMPTEPRADGTFNYCREAIIDIARDALSKETT